MAKAINYHQVLNRAQAEAATTLDGPVLVIAGAGSGKTRTLIYRVARLVESGIPPESILLLTFTRKASQEMLDRAAALTDARCRFVSGGTFHSLAYKVLRTHAEELGYSRAFTILDRSDMEEILRSLVPELNIQKGGPVRLPKRGTLANILSKAANLQCPIDQFMSDEYGQFMDVIPQIVTLDRRYREYKQAHQLMDYDDLIINLRKLLAEKSHVRKELNQKYSHIMVDEYQDTNAIQAETVKWLGHEHRNVMVVGDDSQSIYSFRGADYRNMLDFPSHYPECKIIKLEQNYRSTQPILSLTNALMEQAGEKYTKCLYTEREGGQKPSVVDTRTPHEQALFIARHLREALDKGKAISDFAVLFRAAYHSFELEAELTRQGIPYMKYGGFKFLESAHIKDFLAHMRVAVNPDETVSWMRILRLLKNIGMGKSQKIILWMQENQIRPHAVAQWPGVGKREKGLKALGALLGALMKKGLAPDHGVKQVLDYYMPILKERFDDYPRRQKELEQLIPMAARYKKIGPFLDDLVLDPPTSAADIEDPGTREKLTLSTVHSAKGLEWSEVFVIWALEGRFPPARALNNPMDLEEERRLMYVAATRAKDRLIFTYPGRESVPMWDTYPYSANGISSFIATIPRDFFYHESGAAVYQPLPKRPKRTQRPVTRIQHTNDSAPYTQGEQVRHPAFGLGVVSKMVSDDKVEVFFKSGGKKLLHLAYTVLEKI